MRALVLLPVALLAAACTDPARFDTGVPDLFGTAPVAAPPPPVVEAPEVRLIAAIEDEGCVLTGDNVGAVLLRANLTQAELTAITPGLAEAGRLEVAGDGAIRVLTTRCV